MKSKTLRLLLIQSYKSNAVRGPQKLPSLCRVAVVFCAAILFSVQHRSNAIQGIAFQIHAVYSPNNLRLRFIDYKVPVFSLVIPEYDLGIQMRDALLKFRADTPDGILADTA